MCGTKPYRHNIVSIDGIDDATLIHEFPGHDNKITERELAVEDVAH